MVSPVGTFFIVLFVLLIVAAVGWIVFTQLRARRLGLPAPPFSSYIPFVRSESSSYGAPQPAPGGIRGWINDKVRALRSSGNRSATGAGYERPSRRGFGPLDPDEAWDARVGNEADTYYGYEEQELGLRPQGHAAQRQADTAYSGAGYSNVNLRPDEQRGRTLNRKPGVGSGVDRGPSAGTSSNRNPFDDDAAEPSNLSLRGVSPRPIDTGVANSAAGKGKAGAHHDSPTSERRSIFRENV